MGFVILQAEELSRLKCLRRQGRMHHHLDNIGRQADHFLHGGAQPGIEIGHQGSRLDRRGRIALQGSLHHGESLLGAGHGAHHVAGERRVKVAEKADGMLVLGDLDQRMNLRGFGRPFGVHLIPRFIQGLVIFAAHSGETGMFAGQGGVGLGAGGHQNGAGRQGHLLAGGLGPSVLADFLTRQTDRLGMAVVVHLDGGWRDQFHEAKTLVQGIDNFVMVEGIARGVDHAPAIGDGDAAPLLDKLHEVGTAPLFLGRRALFLHILGMGQELVGDLRFLLAIEAAHRLFALFVHQNVIALAEFLHLAHVIGHGFGGRIDGGEAAADHHRGQPQLQIGDGFLLGRTGQLQRHQKVRGLTHATGQAVGHRKIGGLARARAHGDMVESHGKGRFLGDGTAETHTAEHGEERAPFHQQTQHLEEILVPTHGDSVFGDAAEPGHGALVQVLIKLGNILDRLEGHVVAAGVDARNLRVQGLDLEAVHGYHRMARIHQVMPQRESRRAKTDNQNLVAAFGQRHRLFEIKRVPARQQAVNLESPWQSEHVLDDAGLHLGDFHRFLLLEDTGLGTFVTDTVAGARHQGIVDDDDGQGGQGKPVHLHLMHFRDTLVQRTADQRDPQGIVLEVAGFLILGPDTTGIAVAVVADDTVIGVIIGADEVHAVIGQGKPVAAIERLALGLNHHRDTVFVYGGGGHQVEMIKFFNEMEQSIRAVTLLARLGMCGPGGIPFGQIKGFGVGFFILEPVENMLGEGNLVEVSPVAAAELPGQLSPQRGSVELFRIFGRVGLGGAALNELAFTGLDPGQGVVALRQFT